MVAKRGTAVVRGFEIPSDLAKTLKSIPSPARVLTGEGLKRLGKAISSGKIPSPTKQPPLARPAPGTCGFLGCPDSWGGQPFHHCEVVNVGNNRLELRCYYSQYA
jgi:hypothetical protein